MPFISVTEHLSLALTVLNALLTNSKIVLQLSLREGFEVKVSEALHHGKPTIATRAGGIPLQIIDGKSGYLVDVHDTSAVANHLYNLWMDKPLYDKMSAQAAVNVSDEVGTVGNAASWLYLASKFAAGEKLKPNGRWINDMMREDAGVGLLFRLFSTFAWSDLTLVLGVSFRSRTERASRG